MLYVEDSFPMFYTVDICYDDEVTMHEDWWLPNRYEHSIMVMDNYDMPKDSKESVMGPSYTYTFTDADYEYAVSQNEGSGI